MVQLLRFRTSRFDPAAEDPNPNNPIPGQGLLLWLCERLRSQGYSPSDPDTEDWGWYVYVVDEAHRHLIGASGEPASDGQVDWTLQIHRNRGLIEKLRGTNQLGPDAPLVGVIESLLRGQSDFTAVELESEP